MLPDTPRHRRLALAARAGYALVICLATLSNLHLEGSPRDALVRAHRAFETDWLSARIIIVDGLRNILLFAGFGVVWVVTSRRVRARWAVLGATLVGAALSAFVESVQLYSPSRYASVLDLVTNAGGAALGAAAIVVLVELARWGKGRRSFVGVPAFGFAASYLAALVSEGIAPTFPRLGQPPGVPRLRERLGYLWRWWLADPSPRGVPLTDALLAVPAGAFVVAALAELGMGYGAAAGASAALCGGAVLLAQLTRATGGQPIDSGVALAHAGGAALGALLAWRLLPAFTRRARGPSRAARVLVAYALVLAAWSLRPFLPRLSGAEIAEQFTSAHWIPLRMLGRRGDVFTVADVMDQFFLVLPLGALLSVWPLRRTGALRSALPAVYLAAALELAQAFTADRSFDVTDFLIQVAGAAVGWMVVRQAGYQPYGEVLGPRAAAPGPRRPPPRAAARIITGTRP